MENLLYWYEWRNKKKNNSLFRTWNSSFPFSFSLKRNEYLRPKKLWMNSFEIGISLLCLSPHFSWHLSWLTFTDAIDLFSLVCKFFTSFYNNNNNNKSSVYVSKTKKCNVKLIEFRYFLFFIICLFIKWMHSLRRKSLKQICMCLLNFGAS